MTYLPEMIPIIGAAFNHSNLAIQLAGGNLSFSEMVVRQLVSFGFGMLGIALSQLANQLFGSDIDPLLAYSILNSLYGLTVKENGHNWVVASGLTLGAILGFVLPQLGIRDLSRIATSFNQGLAFWKWAINQARNFRMPDLNIIKPILK